MTHCRERGFDVQHGEFGADMQVPLQLPHKRSAKALILPLPGNNNFNQIIRGEVAGLAGVRP